MKKNYMLIFVSLLCAVLLVLSSCTTPGNVPNKDNAGTRENTEETNTTDTGSSTNTDRSEQPANSEITEQPEEPKETDEQENPEQPQKSKILVAYFSCTGTTKAVAEKIAELIGGNLYEIVPSDPYTAADLNYNNNNCRANREMNDPSARPAIAGDNIDLSAYDTVIIGYPIWWGTMPRIINTFLDTYDLSGKTVMPFCTSGGSGVSKSVSDIRSAEPGANVKDGLRASGTNDRNLEGWLRSGGAID